MLLRCDRSLKGARTVRMCVSEVGDTPKEPGLQTFYHRCEEALFQR